MNTKSSISFDFIEKKIREKSFAILSTVTADGAPHSVSMMYATSPPESKISLYFITGRNTKKVRNIENSNKVAIVIPFPHHIIRFAPSFAIQFQGTADLVLFNDSEARKSFSSKKILYSMLKKYDNPENRPEDLIFIKVKPNKKIFCFGIGLNLLKMRKNPEGGNYTIIVPSERL